MKTFEVKSSATGKTRITVVLHRSRPPAPSAAQNVPSCRKTGAASSQGGARRMRAIVSSQEQETELKRRLRDRAVLGHHAPDKKDDDRPDDCTDQSSTLAGLIKAQGLAKIAGDKGADDPENRRHDETGGLVRAGHEELGNHSRHEADDYGPKNAHARFLPSSPWNE